MFPKAFPLWSPCATTAADDCFTKVSKSFFAHRVPKFSLLMIKSQRFLWKPPKLVLMLVFLPLGFPSNFPSETQNLRECSKEILSIHLHTTRISQLELLLHRSSTSPSRMIENDFQVFTPDDARPAKKIQPLSGLSVELCYTTASIAKTIQPNLGTKLASRIKWTLGKWLPTLPWSSTYPRVLQRSVWHLHRVLHT